MCKALFLALGLSLAAASLAGAVAPPPGATEARKDFTGVLKALPGGKMALETRAKTYDLDFASRSASREARKFAGMLVTVRAVERASGLLVHSSTPLAARCHPGVAE